MYTPTHALIACIAVVLGQVLLVLPITEALRTSSTSNTFQYQWLIVGGGPHGVHIATRLLEEVPSISRSDLCIVDNEPTLLHKWKTRTAATGMAFLRSSASYHLDVREDALTRYAKQMEGAVTSSQRGKCQPALFAADYSRPTLDLFNKHCDHVIEKNNLDQAHLQGLVTDAVPMEDHVEVEVKQPNGDTIRALAKNVVLALGNDCPVYPDWVTEEMTSAGKIRHIFDDNFESFHRHDSVAIVGGGISAAHLALKLEREAGTTVHMICRHELREQQFDTHQDWMMDSAAARRSKAGGGQGVPKRQLRFASLDSFTERRNVINRERTPGTVSASVSRGRDGLRHAIKGDRIHWHEDAVRTMTEVEGGGRLSLTLASGEHIEVDRIVLATGFGKHPPAKPLVDRIAERNGLPLCDCGYPAPDESLRWHERIFLAGALAELELGPSARNIAGARLASERIVAAASGQKRN